MKKIIDFRVFKSSTLVESILRMVANNNAGKCEVSEYLIRMKIHCWHCEWVNDNITYSMYDNEESLQIKENETIILLLTWKEVHELTETEADLAINNNLS